MVGCVQQSSEGLGIPAAAIRGLESHWCTTCGGLRGSCSSTLILPLDSVASSAIQGCNSCQVLCNSYLHIKDRSPGDISDQVSDITLQIPTLDAGFPMGLACLDDEGGYSWNEVFTGALAQESPWPMIGKASERKGSARESISVVREWIETCRRSHLKCSTTGGGLPTRVLDVSGNSVFLYVSELEKKPYAALSHCWGKLPIVQTHRTTLKERTVDIAWTSLSKTFQDAITTTRLLGLQYLWIDSLCIIQDDAEDWQRESGSMASIYESAQIVIAASDSTDDNPGFLQTRLPSTASESIYGGADGSGQSYEIKIREGDDHRWYGNLLPPRSQIVRDSSQLSTRGWALQERLLATRYVQFRSQELVWECKTALWCECGTLSRPSQQRVPASKEAFFLTLESQDRQTLYSMWSRIVNTYASKALTNGSDILPALSGLAKRFQAAGAGEYLAGLWLEDLPLSLLWEAHGTRAYPYRAPSWSWASIDTSATGSSLIAESTTDSKASAPTQVLATVNNVSCDLSPSRLADPTGRVCAGRLTITGQTVQIVAMPRNETSRFGSYELPYDWAARLCHDSAVSHTFAIGFHADTIIADLHLEELICILIAETVGAPRALVLRRCKTKNPEGRIQDDVLYERVGIIDRIILGSGVRSGGWMAMFENASTETITII